jgi:myosin heavy subunit
MDAPEHLSEQPAADEYLTGGPSDFAEDVHPSSSWKGEYADGTTKRNEIGMPEMRSANLDSEAVARKANLCVRLARQMLRTASESLIEDQALSLMYLPDTELAATAVRLAAQDEQDQEEAEQAQDEQEQKQAKDAGKVPPQFLEHMKEKKEDADDKDEEKKEAKKASDLMQQAASALQAGDQQQLQAAIQQMVQQQLASQQQQAQAQEQMQQQAQAQQQAPQAQQQLLSQQQLQAQQQQLQAMIQQMVQQACQAPMAQQQMQQQAQAPMMGDDQLLDQMLMDQSGLDPMAANEDIQMDGPEMDLMASEEDEVLTNLFASGSEYQNAVTAQAVTAGEAPRAPAAMPRTASTRTVGTRPSNGVSNLGGAGGNARSTGEIDKLSNLWASAPDVRKHFE